MSDEDTEPNLNAKYNAAEGKFDKLLAAVGASPWSLAAFVAWTAAAIVFGYWCGLRP